MKDEDTLKNDIINNNNDIQHADNINKKKKKKNKKKKTLDNKNNNIVNSSSNSTESKDDEDIEVKKEETTIDNESDSNHVDIKIAEKNEMKKETKPITIITLKSEVSSLIGSWLSTSDYLKDYNDDQSNEQIDKYIQTEEEDNANKLVNPLRKKTFSPFELLDKKNTSNNNGNTKNSKQQQEEDKKNQSIESLTKSKLDNMLKVDQKKQSITNYHKNFKSATSALNNGSAIRQHPYTKTSQNDIESRSSVSHKGSKSNTINNNSNNSNTAKKPKWGSAFS